MATKYAVRCQYQKQHHNQDTGEHTAKRASESAAGARPSRGAGFELKILVRIGILTGFAEFPNVAFFVFSYRCTSEKPKQENP